MEVDKTMKQIFESGDFIQLDPVGQFYASIINEEYPGNYSISAHLKQPINTQVLQQAVNDIMHRLPFLSGRLHESSSWYYHEILPNPPRIKPDYDTPTFNEYYKKGEGHVLRVLYGEHHFRVETIHSICDGRGLSKIVKGLLVQYFELLGVSTKKNDIINCNDSFRKEECENAFSKFANLKSVKTPHEIDAYHHEGSSPDNLRVKTQKFNLSKIKASAKAHGTTINGYILAHMFQSISEERNIRDSKKPITALMPIDLRSFFPSDTIRNFVSGATIVMPEIEKFSDIAKQIQKQLTEIDTDYIQNEINSWQKMIEDIDSLTLTEKRLLLQDFEHNRSKQITTTFSNLGLIKLPDEVENHVEMLEFIISREPHRPYSFGCITVGDTLTLTITSSVKGDDITENLIKRLESAI